MTEVVSAGWEALARGAWSEALGLLEDAGEDPEALEGVGLAHWWLDNADATVEARERAYRLYRDRGDATGDAPERDLVALAERYDRLGADAVAIPAAYTEAVAVKR